MIQPEENAEQVLNEKMMETAYGLETLGLPLFGIETNSANINSETVSKFYMEQLTFDKIFICASGIKTHSDFVKMVEEKMSKIVVGNSRTQRKPAEYRGGICKIPLDREEFHAALVFKSVKYYFLNIIFLSFIFKLEE